MKHNFEHVVAFLAVMLSCLCFSCAPNLKTSLEIRTNGFINENCYQAILKLEPEESAMGLVAKRESAFLKAKNSLLYDLAIENLANYCYDSQLKTGTVDKNKKTAEQAAYKNALIDKIKGLANTGKISFIYYNEKNCMMIGYRMDKIGFKKKLEGIINPPAHQGNENPVPSDRS
jgi:hypothetical protein